MLGKFWKRVVVHPSALDKTVGLVKHCAFFVKPVEKKMLRKAKKTQKLENHINPNKI